MSILGRVNLSNENYEGSMVDATEAIIEGDLAYADAMELAQEAKLDAQAMMTLEDATQALEAKISNEEYLLANPEKITTEVVALANESYAVVAHILGASEAEMEGMLSNESIESSPVSAMNISHEGVKDFLKKLYDSIKLLFKKIGNAIKKVVTKLIVAMNGVEKAAKKLQDSLKKGTDENPKETNLKDKDGKVWSKYFTAICGVNDIKKIENETPALELIDFHIKSVELFLNGMYNDLKDVGDTIAKNDADFTTVKKKIEELKSKTDDKSKKEFKAISHFIDGEDTIMPVAFVNDQLKGLLITITDGGEDKYDIKFKAGSIKSQHDLDSEVKALTKTQVNKILAGLIPMAKGLKKFSDNRMKEIDNMYKDLDKMAENKTSNALSKFMLKQKASFGTNIRALVAGVYLDSVLAYSSATKKLLAYCRDNAALLKANEL